MDAPAHPTDPVGTVEASPHGIPTVIGPLDSAPRSEQRQEFVRHGCQAHDSWCRFQESGCLEDLDSAISLQQTTLILCPDDDVERGATLYELALFLFMRYERWGELGYLERAISMNRAALESLRDGHSLYSSTLNNTAIALLERFKQGGRMEDLEESIALHRAALELRPEGDPDRFVSLHSVATSLLTRFKERGRMDDLDESITMYRAALELVPKGDPSRSMLLNNFAASLWARFEQRGRMEDLDDALALYRETLDLRPEGHPSRYMSLSNIGLCLWDRFKQRGRMEDLEHSITANRAALKLVSEAHPYLSMLLNNTAVSLLARFEHGGRIEDLEESIAMSRSALKLRPNGHPARSMSLNNIAISLWQRFQLEGRLEDLEESITLLRAVLELHPEGHPERSMTLNNIAMSLWTRFEHQGRMDDIEESITLNRAALQLRPEGHPLRSMSLINIASTLLTRFERGGRIEDLEESIALNRAALKICPEGNPFRAGSLNNIANSLLARFDRGRRVADLEEAISLQRAALQHYPEGHPLRSSSLNNLSNSLAMRFGLNGRKEDLDETVRTLRCSTAHSFSSFSNRIEAAQKWITFARRHDHHTLPEAYTTALSLLQRSLTIRHTLSAQHKLLSSGGLYQSLALDASSYAIGKGDFPRAIEILEQGRALLWSQLRGFRSPLEQLSQVDNMLAEKFSVCNLRLEAFIASSESSTKGAGLGINGNLALSASQDGQLFDEKLAEMRRLYEEQEALIEEIRRIPGFENFLRAAPFEDIQRSAAEGPVIVLNYSKYRCDALVVLPRESDLCVCVPLDKNFYDDAAGLHEEFLHIRQKFKVYSLKYDEVLRRVMKFLWDRVVSKVVEKFREMGIKEGSRIWWCPTSLLTAFPFHAAGPYEDASGKTKYLLDDYISSYAPTLTSLIMARSGVATGSERMLFVADNELPSAKKERNSIIRIRRFKQLAGDEATPEAVLKVLQKARWVHFVCHGQLDKEEPFNSSLRLPGGRLTLLDIARANLPNAEFAFLSACHTAEQGPEYALDEALHLAAAMQFCGFRSVIGTMWQLLDRDGPFIAGAVYAYLMRDPEDGGIRFKRGAAAVREAALGLREHGEPDPTSGKVMTERWVNLVHIGA